MRKKRRKKIISLCILIGLSLQILALPYLHNPLKKAPNDDVQTPSIDTIPFAADTSEKRSLPKNLKQANHRDKKTSQPLAKKHNPLQTLDQENAVRLLNESRDLIGSFSTIQGAVDQSRPNDTIIVNSTTYNSTLEKFPIEIAVNNLTLMSTPMGRALIEGKNTTLLKIDGSKVTVEGFKIVGGKNGISLTGKNIFIENNTIVNNSNYGIYLKNSERSTIINNEMNENRIGFYVTGKNATYYNHTITDNDVKGKKAYYFFNVSSTDITTDETKHLSIVYSKDLTITGKTISNGDFLRFSHVHNVTITKSSFNGNYAGIQVEESWNLTVKNSSFTSNVNGVTLKDSDNITTISNTFETNKAHGIYAEELASSTISQNQFNQSMTAISLNSTLITTVSNNSLASANPYGIHLTDSTKVTVIENLITNCKTGVYLETSNANTISKNTIETVEKIGIFLQTSNDNEVNNCTISPAINTAQTSTYGIYLKKAKSNHIEGNIVKNFSKGAFLEKAEENLFIQNRFSSTKGSEDPFGIHLLFSSNNTLAKNKINSKNSSGIRLSLSGGNELKNNEIEETTFAISLYRAINNHIVGNQLLHSDYGVYLSYGSSTTVLNNQIVEIGNNGIQLTHSDNTILRENEVSKCKQHGILLSYSNNGEISRNKIFNNSHNGIHLLFSHGLSIVENNVTFNFQSGIYLFRASNNVIMANNISKNYHGLYLNHANDNIIVRNTLEGNEGQTIKKEETTENRITNNTFQGEENGIFENLSFIRLVILLGVGIVAFILFFIFVIKRK